ncbi:MAG: hypothetical protein GY938_03950 [Ketobacter sp.]|nr:hypothetical protein [Ketobacter sp.]
MTVHSRWSGCRPRAGIAEAESVHAACTGSDTGACQSWFRGENPYPCC